MPWHLIFLFLSLLMQDVTDVTESGMTFRISSKDLLLLLLYCSSWPLALKKTKSLLGLYEQLFFLMFFTFDFSLLTYIWLYIYLIFKTAKLFIALSMVSNRSGSPYVLTHSKNKYHHLNTCRDMSLNLK